MTNRIAVLGSINVDTTYHVARFPEPGETLSATDKSSAPGGKGLTKLWPLLVPGRRRPSSGWWAPITKGVSCVKPYKKTALTPSLLAMTFATGPGRPW